MTSRIRLVAAACSIALMIAVGTSSASALDEPYRLYNSAHLLVSSNRLDDALVLLNSVLDKYPQHGVAVDALLLLGAGHLRLRRFADAAQSYDRVLSMPAADDNARHWASAGLGLARERQGQWCEAMWAYRTVIGSGVSPIVRDWALPHYRAVQSTLTSLNLSRRATIPERGPIFVAGAAPFFPEVPAGDECTEKSPARVHSYRRQCELGDMQGCSKLGNLYEHGIQPLAHAGNPKLAAQFYRLGCDGGAALGCRGLAGLYHRGLGIAKRPERAAALYHRACDDGDALACANLASLYEAGIGVAADGENASKFYRRACDLGARVCEP